MATTDPAEAQPQFGMREPGWAYADRPCAYGVVARVDGRIAVAHIERSDGVYDDLPGGALDPGEDDAAALVREFGEETGLKVAPMRLLARAGQYMRKVDGDLVNNRSALFAAQPVGEDPALKIEADHTLVWLEPVEAIRLLRHESHAYAVMLWLRAGESHAVVAGRRELSVRSERWATWSSWRIGPSPAVRPNWTP